MKSRIMWLILSFLMALSLVLASCATTTEEEEEEEGVVVEEEEEEEEEEEGPPPGTNWWDKYGEPEYGGTLTIRTSSLKLELDPYNTWGGQYGYCGDFLWSWDWTLDREIWDYSTSFVPNEYWAGCLAESWDMPDAQTVIVHLRQGIYWQDKPPLNGREFTAHDVQHHYDRMMGTGSGYTQPNPFWMGRMVLWESVTATDDYTVVFKFNTPTFPGFRSITERCGLNFIEAPELVKQPGGFADWRNAVGTGPWLLTDFVAGSSETFDRNTAYWGYDERYPQNQLPYVDKLKVLCIPDMSTSLAALRTGKIGRLDRLSWQQAQTVAKSNPELQQTSLPAPGQGAVIRVDKEPFTDVNVRKALEMSLDRRTIAQSFYGGTVDGVPCGLISPAFKGYSLPFEEWPEELQEEYSYNPDRARELLAEAGYPEGFKTNCVMRADLDKDLVQIFKAYFMDIGVDMEIIAMDPVAAMPFAFARKHDQMWWQPNGCGRTFRPEDGLVSYKSTDMANYGCVKDPNYDAIYTRFLTSTSADEGRQVVKEADIYVLERHWTIITFPIADYSVWQPWVKGFTGEQAPDGWIWSRLWIDKDLKESMGR